MAFRKISLRLFRAQLCNSNPIGISPSNFVFWKQQKLSARCYREMSEVEKIAT
jgi:hypothetical protein